MIAFTPCPECGAGWPSGTCCSLAADHLPNLSPSGPHCPSPILLPPRDVHYSDGTWVWTP